MSATAQNAGSTESIDALAAGHVARLACGASAAERQAIYDWVAADPRHAVAFARMESAWEASARLRGHTQAIGTDADAPVLARTSATRASRRRWLLAAAASVAAAMIFTIAWRWAADVELYRTGIGERRLVALADGSIVRLNTASTIEVSMSSRRRTVRLVRGEALFEVRRDAVRPFVVDAGAAELQALGTAFNVRLRDDLVELTVTHGAVAIATPDADAAAGGARVTPRIDAGAGAVIRSGTIAPTRLDGQLLRQRTAWQRGVVEFEGETLARVVHEFNRYRVGPIVIGDARLETIRIEGRFEVDDAARFLEELKRLHPIEAIPTVDGGLLLVERV